MQINYYYTATAAAAAAYYYYYYASIDHWDVRLKTCIYAEMQTF